MMQILKSKSLLTTTLLVLLIAVCFLNNPRQKNGYYKGELEWDVFSYYMYLPYTFIYQDVKMRDPEIAHGIFKKYDLPGTYYQAFQLENGNWTPNYTMGFALLWLPYFFIGHTWAGLAGYAQDGWSVPYQFSIACGTMIYVLIGLFFLRKVLLRFFSEQVTSLTLLLLVLGTNYFHEAINDYMMPHAMIFTGYAMLLYYTIRWHETMKSKYIMMGGLVMGIMILARPSELICVLIPLLWNVYDKESLRRKIELIREKASHFLLLLFFLLIPFIPQFVYWKYITGDWIFNSYKNTGGFDWIDFPLLKVLFSAKKGWLIYTPLIIFPIIGIFLLKRANKNIFLPILIFFLVNFYLLASKAGWWEGGSFSMRYYVDSYPVMAIPFGYMLIDIGKRARLIKLFLSLVITFFLVLNLFQTWQYMVGIIPESRMTWPYYKKIFFNTKVTDEDKKLMEVERFYESVDVFKNESEYSSHALAFYDFDKAFPAKVSRQQVDTSIRLSGNGSLRMSGSDAWGPYYKIRYDDLVPHNKDHAWIRVTVHYFTMEDIKDNPASVVINMPHGKNYNLKYSAFDFEKSPSEKGKWNKVSYDYMTPYPFSEKDYFEIYIWHRGKGDLFIDDFLIEAFLKKDG